MAYMGTDYSVLGPNDKLKLDITFRLVSDPIEVCIQSVYKKMTTAFLFWAQDKTIDLRALQNAPVNKPFLERLKQKILAIFSDELRYQILGLDVLFDAPNKIYINMQVMINQDPNLVLKLKVVSGSNEVIIERVQ